MSTHQEDHSWYDCDICLVNYVQEFPDALMGLLEMIVTDGPEKRVSEKWRLWILQEAMKRLNPNDVLGFKTAHLRGEDLFPEIDGLKSIERHGVFMVCVCGPDGYPISIAKDSAEAYEKWYGSRFRELRFPYDSPAAPKYQKQHLETRGCTFEPTYLNGPKVKDEDKNWHNTRNYLGGYDRS